MGSPSSSKFAILGVAEKYDLDVDDLERRYRARSREVHPDRFARAPVAERLKAIAASTALNDAYQTLRSPIRRAEHLLALRGVTLDERDTVGQEFLIDILELREALAEAKASKDAAALARLDADMRARHQAALRRIGELFAAGGAAEEIKKQLVDLRYFQRFLDEAGGAHGDEDAA